MTDLNEKTTLNNHHDHHDHHDCPICIHEHEGALAVSFDKDVSMETDKLIEHLKQEITELENAVKENHGLVGHIKAALTTAENTYLLSLTKNVVNETANKGGYTRVSFAAIIIGVSEEVLHEAVEQIYESL